MYLLRTDSGTAKPEKHYAATWEKKDSQIIYIATDYDIFCEIIAC